MRWATKPITGTHRRRDAAESHVSANPWRVLIHQQKGRSPRGASPGCVANCRNPQATPAGIDESSRSQASAQRRQQSAQVRQCSCISACCRHSSAHIRQAMPHASSCAWSISHSGSVCRESMRAVAPHASAQSRFKRMHRRSMSSCSSPRQASAQATQHCSHSKHDSIHSTSPSIVLPECGCWESIFWVTILLTISCSRSTRLTNTIEGERLPRCGDRSFSITNRKRLAYSTARRSSCALMATITVLSDMSTAPRAGVKRIPQPWSTPAASGMATIL